MIKPQTILLLIETSKAFGRKLLGGISRYINEQRCNWAVYVEERGKRERLPVWFNEFEGDGVIAHSPSVTVLEALKSLGVPMVETDMCGMDQRVPMVYSREESLVEAAIDHFLSRGLTQIAWCQLLNRPWCNYRRHTLLQRLAKQDLHLASSYVPRQSRDIDWFQQRSRLIDWLRQLPRPTGIFCANDFYGTRLLEAARLAEISVPEEIAVLGVDDDPVLCSLAWPPLSSVDQNAEQIGFESARLLERLLAGQQQPDEPIWVEPAQVVMRQSTDVVAADHPDLIAAVRFIRDRACRGVNVQDVLKQVPVSRSQLEKLFRTHLGCSPKSEIQRVRLERAKQLLLSAATIADIAERCGYRSSQYFANAFQREVGATPTQWRAKHRGI